MFIKATDKHIHKCLLKQQIIIFHIFECIWLHLNKDFSPWLIREVDLKVPYCTRKISKNSDAKVFGIITFKIQSKSSFHLFTLEKDVYLIADQNKMLILFHGAQFDLSLHSLPIHIFF